MASTTKPLTNHGPTHRKRSIAVLTSGGDSPGMNGAVRAIVRMAIHQGCISYAIYEGYEGLVSGGDLIKQMHWEDVRDWLSQGGTLIGTARCKAFMERAGRLLAAKNMVIRGIDALIVCGGDGSLTGADILKAEWPSLVEELVRKKELTAEQVRPFKSLNIVGLVGSIDNDLASTDATIGCYSSLHRICDAVDDVIDTAGSHKRAFVIEVMGRHCGWLALMAAISTGADWLCIPEMPPREGWEEEMCSLITERRGNGKRKTIIIVSEGAQDSNLQKITSQHVKDILTDRLGLDTRVTVLGHIQRGGRACSFDRYISTLQGIEAVNAVLEDNSGQPSPVITIHENKIERAPLRKSIELTKMCAQAIKDKDFATAMDLRDTEFKEYHSAYVNTASVDHRKMKLPGEKHMRIAIIHVGAPAGGMNQATRAAVSYCLTRGHTPIAIHNGFPGLCRHHADELSSIREINWLESDTWVNLGGSEIGANRGLPSENLEETAKCFAKYRFEALLVIGGFGAFTAVSQLRKARDRYDAFKIPLVLLPATISNNVPGTEYSLGSDTCLNALVTFCDTIRQYASSSRRCVFVVETQGGRCGYIATVAGLALGASAVYIPEEGIDMGHLVSDIRWLGDSFARDRGANRAGKIILRNECTKGPYTTQVISDIIKEEAHHRFESYGAVPGHFQNGDKPSPIDRARALRMAIKCVQFIEGYSGKSKSRVAADSMSAVVIGIKGSQLVFSPMGGDEGLEAVDTDWSNKKRKNEFWLGLKDVVDVLAGRPTEKNKKYENIEGDGWRDYEST